MSDVINSFRREYAFLSNMYPVNIPNRIGINITCVEALFQACKSNNPEDWKLFDGVDGKTAKIIGRNLTLREDWDTYRLHVMQKAIDRKFENKELAEKLLKTWPKELVEGNNWGDTFWGVCNGRGENHLGKILMAKRTELFVNQMDEKYNTWLKANNLEASEENHLKWLMEEDI